MGTVFYSDVCALEANAADRAALALRRQDLSTGEAEVAAAWARIPTQEELTVSRTLVADVIGKGVSRLLHDVGKIAVPDSILNKPRFSGEKFPLLGRLLGGGDFFDALTSARCYRPPLEVTEAIRLIQEGAGSHFDPEIPSALVGVHLHAGVRS